MNQNHQLNVLLVQYNPIHKKPEENIKRMVKLFETYDESHKIDVVVFPEMTLTGYVFSDILDIYNLLEEYNKGVTFDFASSLAKRLKSYVFLGYPEKIILDNGKEKYFNAAMIIDREGNAINSYRKSFLYETDKTWAEEGNGFTTMKITTNTGKEICLGIGICMDINPYEFKSPFEKMEFSSFCRDNSVDAIVFLTNWTEGEEEPQSEISVINYWFNRCSPIVQSGKCVYFLAANRTGKEKTTSFTGGSCILKLEGKNSQLVTNLNKKEEKIIYSSLPLK